MTNYLNSGSSEIASDLLALYQIEVHQTFSTNDIVVYNSML